MQKVCFSLPVFAMTVFAFVANATEVNLPSVAVLDKTSSFYDSETNKITYENSGDITAGTGGNTVLVNAEDAAVDIKNTGNILAPVGGFGIYGHTTPTTGGPIYIDNQGTIERIQLQEFSGVTIFNQAEKPMDEEGETDTETDVQADGESSSAQPVPTIKGSMLFGTNAMVSNLGGRFENFDGDDKNNTIAFAGNGTLHNGVQAVVSSIKDEDGVETIVSTGLNIFDSTITTDNILFLENGFFSNGSKVDVQSVNMGNKATIRNVNDPYIWRINGEDVAGKILPDGANFKANNIQIGNDSNIFNEMGATFESGQIITGANTVITNGADYYFNYLNQIGVTTVSIGDSLEGILGDLAGVLGDLTSSITDVEVTTNTIYFPIPKIPHASQMNVDKLVMGENSSLINNGNSVYQGNTIDFKDSGKLIIQAGKVDLTGDLTFKNNGMVSVSSIYQPSVYVPELKDTNGSTNDGTTTTPDVGETVQSNIMTIDETLDDALGDVTPVSGTLTPEVIDVLMGVLRDNTDLSEADLKKIELELKANSEINPDKEYTAEEIQNIINNAINGVGGGSTGGGSDSDASDDEDGDGTGDGSQIPDSNPSTGTGVPTVPDELKDYVEYKEVLSGTLYDAILKADNIKMGDNGAITVTGGILNTKRIDMGDNAVVIIQSAAYSLGEGGVTDGSGSDLTDGEKAYFILPGVSVSEGIYMGNSSTLILDDRAYQNGINDDTAVILTPSINFKNDGRLALGGNFTLYADSEKNTLGKINMAERGFIQAEAALKADVTLGTDSNVLLTNQQDDENSDTTFNCDHCYQGGTILGSLKKAEGANNVHITVNVDDKHFAKLDGDINVDSILVDVGLLEAAGEVKGNIYLNTDTTFRVTSSSIKNGPLIIHDPISRLDNTTNTTVEVLLNDKEFYKTTNTINVENLIVHQGGIEINKPVWIDNVLLNNNATIRLTDNFKIGEIKEFNNDAVNTTLEIDAKGKSVNSSGSVYVDRILVSSGNYNALHEINIAASSANAIYPTSFEEGVELGSGASLTAYADISVPRIVRDQTKLVNGETVTNTTLNVNSNHFEVRGNVDVDNLNMNGGVFEFLNEAGSNAVNVTNDIHLKPYAALAGSGILNVKSGLLTIDKNSRLAVSNKSVDETPLSELKIVSSNDTIINSAVSYTTKDLTVKTDSSGYIDVRAKGADSDKITVDGTVDLADGTRIIVRDIEVGQSYEILSANDLNANADKLRTTFLWMGTKLSTNNNTLSVQIDGIQTLKEGIEPTKRSKNVDELANLLTDLRQSEGAYTIDPFIDNVYFASSADEAVEVLDEYSPEGYLNTLHAANRMQKVFKESVMSEMNAMRNYRVKHDLARGYYVRQPYYYGRPGYERYYQGFRYVRQNPYGQRRTDRGGLWAKPFAVSVSQDNKDNQSGYDFDAYGFTAGIDKKVGVLTLGLAAMYATGDMEQKNKKFESDMTTYGLGIYASVNPHYSRTFMDFYALWSETSNSTTRKVTSLAETAKADFDVSAFSIGANLGYEFMVTRNFIITPKIGLDYTSIEMDDVMEKGSGYAVTDLKGSDLQSIQTPIELKAALDFGNPFFRFKPEAHVRWTHEFGDTASKSTARFVKYATPFAVEGLNVDTDTFTVGGSLLWLYGMSELELKYDYDFSSSMTGHTINMGYKYLF